MGSHHTVTESIRGFAGIVPGPLKGFRGSTGRVRRSGNCSTTSNTVAWAVGGHPSLNGLGAPAPPPRPMRMGRGNPKGEGLHLTWEALLPPWPPPPTLDGI